MLATLNNLAMTYRALGRDEEALRLRRDVYFGYVKLHGKENDPFTGSIEKGLQQARETLAAFGAP